MRSGDINSGWHGVDEGDQGIHPEYMIHLLSTKKLSFPQKELLLNAGFGVVERNFISIIPLEFYLNKIPDNLIFTSKNAVRAILNYPKWKDLQKKEVFAVGIKTAEFLKKKGFHVNTIAHYGKELAENILVHHSDREFLFFCGKKRNHHLPDILKKNRVSLEEIEVYDTVLTPTKIDRIFDGILFFSPSGVKSYFSENDIHTAMAFCIGTTTASEAKKYTDNILIATRPSIENVIVQAVKHYKQSGTTS